jgi:hypothetical protein
MHETIEVQAMDSSSRAIATTPSQRKPKRPPPNKSRLSPKMRQAIELWVSGAFLTKRALAEHCGISECWLYRVFERDDVISLILERTRQRIAMDVPVARARLMQLLAQDDNRGVAKDAVLYALGVSGIIPPRDGRGTQVNVNIQPAGYIVRLKGRESEPATIDAKGELIEG